MCIHTYTHKYYKHIHIYNIHISSIDTYMYNTCTGARGSGNIYVYTHICIYNIHTVPRGKCVLGTGWVCVSTHIYIYTLIRNTGASVYTDT